MRRATTFVIAGLSLAITLVASASASPAAPAKATRQTYTCGGEMGPRADFPTNRFGATRMGTGPLTYCPVTARTSISQEFGTVSDTSPAGHSGMDFNGETGDPIFAATSGRVMSIGDSGNGYGNMIAIVRNDGVITIYAHLSRITVNAGQHVTAGHRIGLMGSTGASTGSHLHFEVAFPTGARGGYGTPTNPRSFLWGNASGNRVGWAHTPPPWSCAHYGGC